MEGQDVTGGKGGMTAWEYVPLIASGLAPPQGKVSNDLIEFTDFYPTLASRGFPQEKMIPLMAEAFSHN